MPSQLQVVAGIILAASPRCFPYNITKAAMWDTAVGIWSALEWGNRGQHRPGWAPRVRQGAMLTTGLVQTLHCKYIGCTQYSFWQCYVSHCNLAVRGAANDCSQPMAVLNLRYSYKKYLLGNFVVSCTNI